MLDEYDGWSAGACPIRPQPPADYKGSIWGGVPSENGFYLTRRPEFIFHSSWLHAPNVNAMVHLDDITEGGVTYRCVSVAGSQYADGSVHYGGESFVWFQTNWAPTHNLGTRRPRAGLALVQVQGGNRQTEPEDQRCELKGSWLVNDAAGEPERWDAEHKLCGYKDTNSSSQSRKTVVGPEYFVLMVRRNTGSTGALSKNKITYYQLNQATPTTKEWNNPESSSNVGSWLAMDFDPHCFPMGIFCKIIEHTTFGNGSLKAVTRSVREGEGVIPAMTLDTSDKASHGPANRQNEQLFRRFSKTDEDSRSFSWSDTNLIVRDFAMGNGYRGTSGVLPWYYLETYGDPLSEEVSNNNQYMWHALFRVDSAGPPQESGGYVDKYEFEAQHEPVATPWYCSQRRSDGEFTGVQNPGTFVGPDQESNGGVRSVVSSLNNPPDGTGGIGQVRPYLGATPGGYAAVGHVGFASNLTVGGLGKKYLQVANKSRFTYGDQDALPLYSAATHSNIFFRNHAMSILNGDGVFPSGWPSTVRGAVDTHAEWNRFAYPKKTDLEILAWHIWVYVDGRAYPTMRAGACGKMVPYVPDQGVWFDKLGQRHEDGYLAYDASVDDLHTTKAWIEAEGNL